MHKTAEKVDEHKLEPVVPQLTEFEALYHDLTALKLPLPKAKEIMDRKISMAEMRAETESRVHEVKGKRSA